MSSLRTNNPRISRVPIVIGVIFLACYLVFLASSWFWEGGWITRLFHEHYVFFVGLPFAGFLAYFVVGTLENVRGQIEFEALWHEVQRSKWSHSNVGSCIPGNRRRYALSMATIVEVPTRPAKLDRRRSKLPHRCDQRLH